MHHPHRGLLQMLIRGVENRARKLSEKTRWWFKNKKTPLEVFVGSVAMYRYYVIFSHPVPGTHRVPTEPPNHLYTFDHISFFSNPKFLGKKTG